jgi:tetratricopeptide (TPR) repeat protein
LRNSFRLLRNAIDYLVQTGEVYWVSLKQYDRAISDATRALQNQPNAANAYALRSQARRRLGDIAGADANAQKLDSRDAEDEQTY